MRPRTLFATLAAALVLTVSPALAQTEEPPDKPAATPAPVHVLMTTSMGDIVIELNPAKAPESVANFLAYVGKKSYDETIFHRVINDFMIQGGGFTAAMEKKPTDPPVTNEWRNGLKNVRGSIAMARLGGNPDSATNQFFINVVDNAFLDRPQQDGAAYAVFGRVVKGMAVVDAIKAVAVTTKGRYQNVPVEPVVIKQVRRIEGDALKKAMGKD